MNEIPSKDDLKKMPFMDMSRNLEERVEDLLQRLTFKEKCMLCAGESEGGPPTIDRLEIPKFSMTDGPHGVSPYKVGVGPSGIDIPPEGGGKSSQFPSGIQLASTWNESLMEKFGKSLAEETRAVGRCMQLGPAMNICRNPMNGRTFEYLSEDPYLSGKMGAAAVRGMQSVRVAPCIKHYVANNFETNRFKVNIEVSRRALEEIYLKGFKICVKESDPWGVMSAYNKINGIFVSEHKEILRTILKDDWGFSGVVVSDFGATKHCTGIKGLVEAGLDLEMGSRTRYIIEEMIQMKEAGEFPEEYFDDNTKRILRTMFRVGLFDDPATVPEGSINTKEHQAVARELAEEGTILLKNENNLLPLDTSRVKKIAIFGKHADIEFRKKKLGGGSSTVRPPYEVTIREGLTKKCEGKVEIIENASEADVAIVCVGLGHTHDYAGGDHEGSDRLRYGLGFNQTKLVRKIANQNANIVLVIVGGQPIGMDKTMQEAPAILEAWYGGMELGTAVAAILLGDINPSGKMPVTWPRRKKDIKTAFTLWKTFIGPSFGLEEVKYDEGIFIGYRYYDKHDIEPSFCFGHGLSYTTFEYTNLQLSKEEVSGDEKLTITCSIKNTGDRNGAEIVQLYIKDVESSVPRPDKELKGFKKVSLKAKESSNVEFSITKDDLSFFDEESNTWKAESGEYEILVGASSRDIRLSGRIK
ncbi:MAG: beta-glucosidase, partial [Candidatus Hodarchaeota archaeon]